MEAHSGVLSWVGQRARGGRMGDGGHGRSERATVCVDVRRLWRMRRRGGERKERRTELMVVLLLLCLLLLALKGGEVSEEIAELLGRFWGMTGLFEVSDPLWRESREERRGRERETYAEDELKLVLWRLADLWMELLLLLLWVELDGHLLACHERAFPDALSRRLPRTGEKPKQYSMA